MLSISTIFWRDSPAFTCSVLSTLSIAIGYFLFRPLSWGRVLGQCPLFLVTGGAFILGAFADLSEALQKFFERYLGTPFMKWCTSTGTRVRFLASCGPTGGGSMLGLFSTA
jgi:hypothetical protein